MMTVGAVQYRIYSARQKKIPPGVFLHFLPNVWEFFVQILHTY